MAPEQFHGKAVFASDLYSLGVTMYQMLTGVAALRHAGAGGSRQADVGRAGVAAAAEEPVDSQGHQRHRHEGDGAGSHGALPARVGPAGRRAGAPGTRRRRTPADAGAPAAATPATRGAARRCARAFRRRLRARETPAARFCWQCRKPLHARTDRCPFCERNPVVPDHYRIGPRPQATRLSGWSDAHCRMPGRISPHAAMLRSLFLKE